MPGKPVELRYTIKSSDTWEIAEFDFTGGDVAVAAFEEGWKWWADPHTYDVVAEDYYNHDFYNVVRIMYNPGDNSQEYSFYMDDLAGPHVVGLK